MPLLSWWHMKPGTKGVTSCRGKEHGAVAGMLTQDGTVAVGSCHGHCSLLSTLLSYPMWTATIPFLL